MNKSILLQAGKYYRSQGVKFTGGAEWKNANCSFCNSSNSFALHIGSGAFYCFLCKVRGGCIVNFHQQKYELTFIQALEALKIGEVLPSAAYYLLQGMEFTGGGEWKSANCSFCNSSNSFVLRLDSGAFYCFSCKVKEGGIVSNNTQNHGLTTNQVFRSLAEHYRSQGVEFTGGTEWKSANCSFCNSSNTFILRLDSGAFYCFSCKVRGGGIVSYHIQKYGLTIDEALEALKIGGS